MDTAFAANLWISWIVTRVTRYPSRTEITISLRVLHAIHLRHSRFALKYQPKIERPLSSEVGNRNTKFLGGFSHCVLYRILQRHGRLRCGWEIDVRRWRWCLRCVCGYGSAQLLYYAVRATMSIVDRAPSAYYVYIVLKGFKSQYSLNVSWLHFITFLQSKRKKNRKEKLLSCKSTERNNNKRRGDKHSNVNTFHFRFEAFVEISFGCVFMATNSRSPL